MTDVVQTGPRLDKSALEQLLAGLTAVRGGDFSMRLKETGDPLMDEIATVFNGMADQLDLFTSQVTRVAREVGTDGNLEGPDRQRQRDGLQPDRAGPVDRPGGDRGGARRPDPDDHGRGEG